MGFGSERAVAGLGPNGLMPVILLKYCALTGSVAHANMLWINISLFFGACLYPEKI